MDLINYELPSINIAISIIFGIVGGVFVIYFNEKNPENPKKPGCKVCNTVNSRQEMREFPRFRNDDD